MICRRCGMESSTTTTCEWCKKPMLPPGGSISAKAKEELIKEKETPPAPAASEAPPTIRAEETQEEAEIRRPEAKPPPPPATDIPGLTALGADVEEDSQPQASVYSTTEQTINEELLVPLGAQAAEGEEGTSTQIYIGNEEEVVRPIHRPNKDGSYWVTDASGRRKRVVDDKPAISDKTRMFRSALAGGVVAFLGAIAIYLVKKQVPETVIVFKMSDETSRSFAGALEYGFYSALLLGFIQGLVMTNFKLGVAVGVLMGAGLGYASVSMAGSTCMPFPLIVGILSGIFAGYFSTKGLKRVVSV